MASAKTKLQLQERVPLPRTAWKLADLAVLFLLLALLACRASSLVAAGGAAPACTWCWVAALICEAWFTVVWFINMNAKWNPVRFDTHPERLAQRTNELPAVDMFVTTADPKLEPPVVTVNTVLSLLALDYPAGKLSCYVSDDGCSAVTCYALREAAEFAKLWVPFCKKHGVGVRAPFLYFSSGGTAERCGAADDAEFMRAWTSMKNEYEVLVRRIENAEEESLVRRGDGEFAEFLGADRRNHPTIIKQQQEQSGCRRWNPKPHIRLEGEEPHTAPPLQGRGHERPDEGVRGGDQCSRHAERGLRHVRKQPAGGPPRHVPPPGIRRRAPQWLRSGAAEVLRRPQGRSFREPEPGYVRGGVAGLQGIFYCGTGCFHRRKVIYGVPPDSSTTGIKDSPSYKELQNRFGRSNELIDSARSIVSGDMFKAPTDLTSRIEAAKQVSACNYETDTSWGQEVGWVYGSMTEDILTGQRIHAAGWRSTILNPDPPAFLGGAPTGGPASLTQYKRWATGWLEILLSRHNPFLLAAFKRLDFRQCVAYLEPV